MFRIFACMSLLLTTLAQAQVASPAAAPQTLSFQGTRFETYREMFRRKTQFYVPPENPTTDAKIILGKTLFFDPRLSGNNAMSCSTCHIPALGFSDGQDRAIGNGGKKLARHTPSLINVAFNNSLMWDSEFNFLEQQALAPIRKKTEMNQDLKLLPAKIKAIKGYAPLFEAAFPGEPISTTLIARALASYQRTLISGPSPFEEFLLGNDNAMSMDAKMGMVLFTEKARCNSCHLGWTFTDGQAYDIGHKSTDRGRGALSKQAWDMYKFKNPPLLDVATHPPYMHDGSLATLEDVVEFYDRGGDIKRPTVSSDIRPLKLTTLEKARVVAFLKSLTSKMPPVEVPELPQ